jgi:glucosamine--fructose-6-phosphate aminotransferase (isomerizing)
MATPAMLSTMSTVTMFHAGVRYPRSLFVAISQSGRSPDLIETTRSMRNAGIPVVALTNDPTSELAVEADVHIDLCAGPERSVAATKTFTAELIALYLLVGTSVGRSWTSLERDVSRTSALVEAQLSRSCPSELDAASMVATEDKLLVVGRGYSFSTAKETALKIMETSALAASGWSSAEALHGPIGQVETGTPVIGFTSDRRARESIGVLVSKVAELGARLITVGPNPFLGTGQASTSGHVSITVDQAPDAALQPLIDVVVGQRLALEVSLRRGMDPDRPAALTKVTRTL